MQREIPLARRGRSDLDIRRLAGTEPISQGVEDLSLAEPADTCRIVWRDVPGPRRERADLEFLQLWNPVAIEPVRGGWVVVATVTFTASMRNHEVPAESNLLLRVLTRRHVSSSGLRGRGRRTGGGYKNAEKRTSTAGRLGRPSHRILLLEIYLTSRTPIMPWSSWSRMWQWNIHFPG